MGGSHPSTLWKTPFHSCFTLGWSRTPVLERQATLIQPVVSLDHLWLLDYAKDQTARRHTNFAARERWKNRRAGCPLRG
jgi:hypothetical protein